jgi:four helix bundle protein
MEMAVSIYRLVGNLPSSERYGLSQQLTKAAVSVAANIAEGNARSTPKDYANFLAIARGSLMETETYLLLAVRLDFLGTSFVAPVLSIITEIDRMLVAMRRKLVQPAEN